MVYQARVINLCWKLKHLLNSKRSLLSPAFTKNNITRATGTLILIISEIYFLFYGLSKKSWSTQNVERSHSRLNSYISKIVYISIIFT